MRPPGDELLDGRDGGGSQTIEVPVRYSNKVLCTLTCNTAAVRAAVLLYCCTWWMGAWVGGSVGVGALVNRSHFAKVFCPVMLQRTTTVVRSTYDIIINTM